MSLFLALAAIMLIAALAFVLVPLLRPRPAPAAGVPQRQRRALDEARAAGVIDEAEYRRKLDLLASTTGEPVPVRGGFVAAALLALLLPAGALLLYRAVGTPAALDPAARAPTPPAAEGEGHGPDMEAAIAALAARLEEQPGDAEGWALLGRAYQATERAEQALAAFRRAHEAAPDNSAVTVEYAQAQLQLGASHRIDEATLALLEAVAKAEPRNQRALWLLGIAHYQDNDFAAAVARWQELLPLLEPGSEVRESVERQIAEAQARAGGAPAAPAPAADTQANSPATASEAGGAEAPRLSVRVELAPALAGKADPSATLFIFARAASGPPMPLAIERLTAAALPAEVVLDDSKGMLPGMSLAQQDQVVIGARVSRSGQATPQSGDLEGSSPPLDVHRREPITVTIDRVVP